ncbi:glycoside hydrolase family 2 TIM barrel-domain containing protein [Robertkochia sediminum]|uniref:glycoside hydrolase family 2 TIM barrel-domain containing protein n=1 Tax=Robertkochia sediminum TaxID=2785326 RepID=UPI001F2A7907|nr:glycoside hydrolase family 2 TIM barrel-domain containing protein [Robertkochia sediminum]
MKLMNWFGITLLVAVAGGLGQCSKESSTTDTVAPDPDPDPVVSEVTVSGRQVLVDGAAYEIRGLCYNPVAKGRTERDFNDMDRDLDLMKEAGVNTVRIYAPIDSKGVLDKFHNAGIKVIVGFGYNQGGVFDILSGTCIDYVNKYKDHPAILFWELGNEYNYHPEWFGNNINTWYRSLNTTADRIHQADPGHPVATAHGELPTNEILELCPNVDVWGMNVYRWDSPGDIFGQWAAISEKPMYLSEAGGDSYMTVAAEGYAQGENQKAQADANANILDEVFAHKDVTLGVTLFAFSDEWWKAGNPDQQDTGGWAPNSSGVPYDGAPNEEYWGLVDIDRNKKEAFFVVKEKYLELLNNQ